MLSFKHQSLKTVPDLCEGHSTTLEQKDDSFHSKKWIQTQSTKFTWACQKPEMIPVEVLNSPFYFYQCISSLWTVEWKKSLKTTTSEISNCKFKTWSYRQQSGVKVQADGNHKYSFIILLKNARILCLGTYKDYYFIISFTMQMKERALTVL